MKHTSRFASYGAALLSSTMLASMLAAPAYAQDSGLDDEFEDVVIVTATLRAEDIQDVPIAVTALSPELLQDNGVVNVQDLAIVAPSFASSQAQTNSGSVVLRIRGVGTTSNNIGFESAVGVFIDGAYQSRPGVALNEFVDVERVEVLRGPQGTLFGRNTSAGALNITNVAPDLTEFGGFADFTYGNYDMVSVQGALNIPIVEDKVAARITGAYRDRDGYIDVVDGSGNDLGASNSAETILLRGQIGFEANNGFEGRLIADYSDTSGSCCVAVEVLRSNLEVGGAFAAVGAGARGGMTGPSVPTSPTDTFGVQQAVDDLQANANFLPTAESDQFGFTANLTYPISDDADLVYVGSYREWGAFEIYDSDFSGLDAFNVGLLDTNIDTMTHELRLQGDAMDGRLSYLIGGYYSDEDIVSSTNFQLGPQYDTLVAANFGAAAGPAPLALFTGGVNADAVDVTNNYTQDSRTFSVFTHNVFDITDKLDVTVGLRYTDESKDGSFSQSNFNNPLCPAVLGSIGAGNVPPPLVNGIFGLGCLAFTAPADLPQAAVFPLPRTFDEEFKDDELVYTAKLGYEITPDVSVYGGFTHGYKSGGFNLDSTAASGGADPRFLSETVDAWEVGLKSSLFDDRLTLNVAGFIEDFENFQVLEFTGAQFATFNVPKARAEGVEIEGFFKPVDGFALNAALTLLDASYPDDCADGNFVPNTATLCGNSLTNAPDVVSVLGVNYDRPLGDTLTFMASAQMRYESDRRTSTQATIVPNAAAIAAAGGDLQAAVDASPDVAFDIQPSNRKINLRVGVGHIDEGWALELWGNNITNELTRGVTFNTVLRGSSRSAFVQNSRQYGVTLRTKF